MTDFNELDVNWIPFRSLKHVADIVVVGAGIMGLVTAAALARAGRRVCVLERFALDHDRGSSHGNVRVFKVSYPELEFVRLAQESLAAWRALEAETGEELLTTTGTLDVGGIAGRGEALEACGAPFEFLAATDVERRFGVTIAGHAEALFQPEGAVLHADRARGALASKLEIVAETAVEELVPGSDGVRLRTTAGELEARAVVVTAGSWVSKLLSPLAIEPNVVAVRETVAYFRVDGRRRSAPLSEWLLDGREVFYGVVGRDGLLKVGVSGSGSRTDPDERGAIDESVVRRAAEWARCRYEVDDDTPVRAETCLYTNTPDQRFVLERHGRVVVGSPCSGHGFKFAPVVGGRLADLALEAVTA